MSTVGPLCLATTDTDEIMRGALTPTACYGS